MFNESGVAANNSIKPLVSVLIPVYNGVPYINQTLDSILNSNYKELEIILVDDGSKDASRKTCREYESKYSNVRFISFEENKGMDRALNAGIKVAKGEYIARINQDDIMMPDRLEKQVKFLEDTKEYVAVGGQIILFTNENPEYAKINFPLTDEEIRSRWLMFSPYSDPTVTYRKSAILNTPGYSQIMWPADDVHMWYMLGSLGKLANLPDVVTKVRWHNGAGSITGHKRQMRKTWEVHKWAEENIQKPNVGVKAFWVAEYIAGVLFPPQFNWFVYRQIKRLFSTLKK
jgi:glycosyltransferase involved in cell wall biosynthesis